MKVVFLDIDGVLNSQRTVLAFRGIPNTTANNGRALLDEVAIRLIGAIVKKAGAKVVLSSTWRKHDDWKIYGPDLDLPIIDKTPSLSSGVRGDEIADWLSRHPEVETYAILDDSDDMLEEQMPYFIRTSGFDGFTWANATLLAKLLLIEIYDIHTK